MECTPENIYAPERETELIPEKSELYVQNQKSTGRKVACYLVANCNKTKTSIIKEAKKIVNKVTVIFLRILTFGLERNVTPI